MPRPPCCRRVSGEPAASLFKPAGLPTRGLPEVAMTLDEFEAIRLADLEGLYQDEAASRMEISRATFGRILEAARRKIAEALVGGTVLRIQGGIVRRTNRRTLHCPACTHRWQAAAGGPRPAPCPRCRVLRRARGDPQQEQGGSELGRVDPETPGKESST